jgi:hypothetical protein
MRTSVTITGGLILLTIGYALGASHVLAPSLVLAQAGGDKKYGKSKAGSEASAAAAAISDEAKAKIRAASDALKAAMEALQAENRYDSAIKGVNTFSVLSGGGNSMTDLASPGGVDPETFAALYAGLAADSVVGELARDAEGRLTYKGRVIRIYPISRLRAAYASRAEITGEELLPAPEDSTTAKPKKKPAEKEKTEESTEEQ